MTTTNNLTWAFVKAVT